MKSWFSTTACLLGGTFLSLSSLAMAADWPQFRGADRTDVSPETGLLKTWPAEGPKLLWLYDQAGLGYSGFSMVKGRLYTLGTRNDAEVLICLDIAPGNAKPREVWVAKVGEVLKNNWGDGPRATPTVDGSLIFSLGGQGNLICVNAADGKILWQKSLVSDLGGEVPGWGYCESPLVDGDQVIVTPGGGKGTMAALDKKTGKLIWQSAEWKEGAQYASAVPATINGEKQYVQLVTNTFAGISAKSGKVLWKSDFPGRTAVIPTPIVSGNQVYVTAGYGVGCKSVQIGKGFEVSDLYANKVMTNHHGGVVKVGEHIYGNSDGGGWTCQKFTDGSEVWAEKKALRKGAIASADGMLYCLEENSGTVVLAEASPAGWSEKGRFKLTPQSEQRSSQGRIWVHPVITNGRLYLRDQEFIYCFDVKGK